MTDCPVGDLAVERDIICQPCPLRWSLPRGSTYLPIVQRPWTAPARLMLQGARCALRWRPHSTSGTVSEDVTTLAILCLAALRRSRRRLSWRQLFNGTPSVKLLCLAKAALLRRPRRFTNLDHHLTCSNVDQHAAFSASLTSGGKGSHVQNDVKRQDLSRKQVAKGVLRLLHAAM